MAQHPLDITPVTGDSGQSGGTKLNMDIAELYSLVDLRELLSNKATNFGTLNDTLYPSVQAVETRILQALAGLRWKAPCDIATTANITLSGEQTIDGILTSTTRILVKNQSTGANNGIYITASGSWTRATDADSATELEGASVTVQRGTSNANTTWLQTSDNISLGSTSIVWAQFGSSVPNADASTLGIAKLYPVTTLGTNTDGAPTQNAAKAYADSKVTDTIVDGTTTVAPSQNAVFDALALKVDKETPTALTDGLTVSWDMQNRQNPIASWAASNTGPTLTLSNVKNGATAFVKITTGTASVITITFSASGFTFKSQNITLTTYPLPAGTGMEYFIGFTVVGTVIETIIGVDGNQSTASTGTAIKFDIPRTYGLSSPETGNITLDTTNAISGVCQLLRHNHTTTAPTFGSEFKILNGAYVVNVVNYIYLEYVSATEVLVNINQAQ